MQLPPARGSKETERHLRLSPLHAARVCPPHALDSPTADPSLGLDLYVGVDDARDDMR